MRPLLLPALAVLGLGALGLAVTSPSPPVAQQTGGAAEADALLDDLHLYNLRVEWEERFFRAWQAADAERKAELAELFAGMRTASMPADMAPLWGTLAVANAIADGRSRDELLVDTPAAVLALQALALDLRVEPGAFPANTADDPEPRLTVHVAPIFELSQARHALVRLVWSGPDGAEVVAREEQVDASYFLGDGFEMFVRAPRSEPGLWHLVLELEGLDPSLETPDAVERGARVPVPCVAELTSDFPPADLLAKSGHRVLGGLETFASEWITAWAHGDTLGEPQRARRRGALVLAAQDGLWPAPLFAGVRGEAWRRALVQAGFAADAFEFYGALPGGQVDAQGALVPSVDSVHRVLERLPTDEPRVLVLRGDAVFLNQLEVIGVGPQAVDAVVIVAHQWRPPASHPDVPTLVLTPSAETATTLRALGDPRLVVEELERSLFLSELELPTHVAGFVRGVWPDLASGGEE